MKALLLFAHGARNPDWARPILAVRDTIRRREPGTPVEAAFLEFIPPTLPEAVEQLLQTGCDEIVIVPMFMAQTGHTQRDLPALLDTLRARHPGLQLRVAAPIGEAPAVVTAIAEYALQA
ncbi:MAG: CbiX/SirB N-terminal domain-containing protein [Sterolibacterium sp.]|jgi:sirohydrochlorin cobaltochelatase|nr:CbiX/SirB N-terminal domain-containing protein [Sterolibacterium sp.]